MGLLSTRRIDRRLPDKLPSSITGAGVSPRKRDRQTQFFGARYDGARRDRITEDWVPGNVSPFALHRADAALLRNRARDLVINNPHAASAIGAYVANVVECGITPKPQIDDRDTRRAWQDAWDYWAAVEADVTETQSFYALQQLWLREVLVGGGCLVHYRVLPRTGRRRIQAALDLIPEERFADDTDSWIAWHNRKKSGNPISRGIELDAATGRRIAYHIRQQEPNASQVGDWGEPVRIPADQARYSFLRHRIGQVRGITALHPVIIWLWKLGYYTDNELLASAIKSCFSLIITQDDTTDIDQLNDTENGTDSTTDIYGNELEKIQPGIVGRLNPGEGVQGVGPNVPGSDSVSWLLMIQRAIAIGTDLSYEELSRDYSQGNFSSVRAAANSDRKRFRSLQQFVISEFCKPAYPHFARWATMAGIDGMPTVTDFAANADEWLRVKWQPPGWMSVNPREDANAAAVKLSNGSTTLQEIGANDGADWEERMEQRARELAKARELDIPLESGGVTVGDTQQEDREPARNE